MFGNWIDGTYAGFDNTHAHMNIPATFAFPVGMDKRPRTVKFNYKDKQGWKVATQLKPLGNGVYYAPNFQYFMDISTDTSTLSAIKNIGKKPAVERLIHSLNIGNVSNGNASVSVDIFPNEAGHLLSFVYSAGKN